MSAIVVNAPFLSISPTGEEHDITVEIGHPYQSSAEEWRCPVSIHGLHGKLADIRGVDALQSLTLALCLVERLLSHFEAEGGQLLDPQTRKVISLQSYFPQHKETTP